VVSLFPKSHKKLVVFVVVKLTTNGEHPAMGEAVKSAVTIPISKSNLKYINEEKFLPK
jgi:hypothetical protein